MVADGNLTPKQGFLNPEHGFRMVRKRKEKKKNREEREKKKKKKYTTICIYIGYFGDAWIEGASFQKLIQLHLYLTIFIQCSVFSIS